MQFITSLLRFSTKVDLYVLYRNWMRKFVEFLQHYQFNVTALVLGTLLAEPWHSLKAGVCSPLSWKKNFNFHNLNPQFITEAQAKKSPILLIHGNYHNQSAWLNFAKILKRTRLGPVYTVNLPSGPVTGQDFAIINNKVNMIKTQYEEQGIAKIKIDVVGHSRGGFIAYCLAWKRDDPTWQFQDNIGRVIKIGSVLNQEELLHISQVDQDMSRLYEIIGEHDILTIEKSLLPSSQHKIVNTGHLELLYSPDTHQGIMQWL